MNIRVGDIFYAKTDIMRYSFWVQKGQIIYVTGILGSLFGNDGHVYYDVLEIPQNIKNIVIMSSIQQSIKNGECLYFPRKTI